MTEIIRICYYCHSFVPPPPSENASKCTFYGERLGIDHGGQFSAFYKQGNPNTCPHFRFNELRQ